MWGTVFNTAMIIGGSVLGSMLGHGLRENYHTIMMTAMGLAVIAIGLNTTLTHMNKSHYPVLFIVSLAVGGVIGEWLDLDGHFNRLLERRAGRSGLSQGLSTGILLFCIGTLSIVGPIEAALRGDTTMLMTNGMLDGVTSTVLASTFGIGMILAAPVLFCWQTAIFLGTTLLRGAISSTMINELSVVGGVLILASGISILGLKQIKTLNLLPSLVIPIIVVAVLQMF